MTNRTIAPEIKNAVDFKLHLMPYERYTLDNGVEIYAINVGEEDVIMIEFVFTAGNSWEKQNIVAAATNHLLKNGTISKTAFEINEHFDYHGSFLKCSCDSETASITLHALNKHLPALLPVISEILTEATFPQEELNIFKQNSKQKLSVNLKKCEFVANRLIDASLYGENHPYGKYSRMEDFDLLTREAIIEFYKNFYLNGNCIVFIGGKLPSDLFWQMNNVFGKLSLRPYYPQKVIKSFNNVALNNQQRSIRITNDINGVQGAVRIARNFPNRHHPDFREVQVLNNLLGGFFGSRLMSNIREDKGYTYGIHSYLENHIEQSAWMISTEAGRDVCEATVKEVYYEMEKLRNTLVDDEELLLVKNFMMGSVLGSLNGPFRIIHRWSNYILSGADESYFYAAIETIRNITAQQLQDLANKYLQPDHFYEMIVV